MVPTKDELVKKTRAKAERPQQHPAEHSQRLGLDVDLGDLESGRIGKSTNPRKMAAQVKDARSQREHNFISKMLGLGSTGRPSSVASRGSLTSADRMRSRAASTALPEQHLPTVPEGAVPSDAAGGGDGAAAAATAAEDDTGKAPQVREEEEEEDTAHPPNESAPLLGDQDGGENDELKELAGIYEAACPDDLHPMVQDMVEKEVHNNHTTWSVIRTHHRAELSESLAVFVQLTVGFCADLSVILANAGNPNSTAWAWGLATMMGIHVSGGVSGAHLNPAVTVVLWFYRGFPSRKLPAYFTAQFLGAFFAAIVAYVTYYQSIQNHLASGPESTILGAFITGPQSPWITPWTSFCNEFLGASMLAIVVLALGDDQNAPPGAGMSSLIIGLVITCLGITFGYQTGGALNPSRDYGPRLALLLFGYSYKKIFSPTWYWLYGPGVGALLGAFVGGFLYDFMIFAGGESPVNYPLERMERALRKGFWVWKKRLHLA